MSFLIPLLSSLIVLPLSGPVDEDVAIHVEGVFPLQQVELRMKIEDQSGILWTSWAEFKTDEQGKVAVEKTAPVAGSYEGIDGMGLFWSLAPDKENKECVPFLVNDPYQLEIELYENQKRIDKQTVTRYFKAPDVQRIEIREEGLIGTFFLPISDRAPPVIICLGGSEGGLRESRAKLLARHGFASLNLAYFGLEGLPQILQNVPLEYFKTAFDCLKANRRVNGSKIGLIGVSRGGELSLILGSLYPESIAAIIAVVPSDLVQEGFGQIDAWTYEGKPFLPHANFDFYNGHGKMYSDPIALRSFFLGGLTDESATEKALIPVEKIRAPLRLISGGDDQLWPSDVYADRVIARLEKWGSRIDREHWNYPTAGHYISLPNLPYPSLNLRSGYWFTVGGTKNSTQHASADSWKRIISFFKETLAE